MPVALPGTQWPCLSKVSMELTFEDIVNSLLTFVVGTILAVPGMGRGNQDVLPVSCPTAFL